jgi:hypothetical protein
MIWISANIFINFAYSFSIFQMLFNFIEFSIHANKYLLNMKKIILFCVLYLYMGINAFPQETIKLKHDVPIKKGKITLKDGKTEMFKKLTLNDHIITYADTAGQLIERNISDVSKIAKRSSYAGYGAIAGAGFTLVLAISNEITESNYQPGDGNIKIDHSEFVEFGILFTGIGAFVGSYFNKYKTLYEDKAPISFSPTVISAPDGRRYAMLSLRFNIR